MYKIILAPIILLIAGAVLTTVASKAFADDAQTQGYNVGKFDFLHNLPYSDSCDPNNGDAFCALYKAGYFAGWHAADALYGNQVPHQ